MSIEKPPAPPSEEEQKKGPLDKDPETLKRHIEAHERFLKADARLETLGTEQSQAERECMELFLSHYNFSRHKELTPEQGARINTYIEQTEGPWRSYDDDGVRVKRVAVEKDIVIIEFDVMGNHTEERIPLSE
jgi:hypothetical protein